MFRLRLQWKKKRMFSTGKGKVCHWIQSGNSTNCFSSL